MKRAIFEISDHLLVELCKGFIVGAGGHYEVVENGLPKDTKVVSSTVIKNGVVGIIVESESFDDVKYGEMHPTLKCPVLRSIPHCDTCIVDKNIS